MGVDKARIAYQALLLIPLNNSARTMAQPALSFLRDYIAEVDGSTPEDVQREGERIALFHATVEAVIDSPFAVPFGAKKQ